MGKDRRNERRTEHFTKMERSLMESDAWRALSFPAKALYPFLKLEWHGPKANNNGNIRLSVRQASDRMGGTPNTAARAFRDLQAKGFIVLTKGAELGSQGMGRSPAYELTEIALPGEVSGRRLYKNWHPENEFHVTAAAVVRRDRNRSERATDTGNVLPLKRAKI